MAKERKEHLVKECESILVVLDKPKHEQTAISGSTAGGVNIDV